MILFLTQGRIISAGNFAHRGFIQIDPVRRDPLQRRS